MSSLPVSPGLATQSEQGFLRQVFLWMFFALGITTASAVYFSADQRLLDSFAANPNSVWILIAVQIGLVIAISFLIDRINATVAAILFAIYAGSVGVTFAILAQVYTSGSIVGAFAGATGVFAGMAAWGYTTQRSLASWGGILFGTLIGFFFASLAYAFIGGETFNLILGLVGVVLFSALTAYDMQKLKNQASEAASLPSDVVQRMVIIGALNLYLDFINLVISLLRLFAARR